MKIGTKSILFGAHCFFIHPFFVALAWWKLYGFPRDPRLWLAFFLHDLGYWGKPNIDGPEGELHPEWGARVMTALFDPQASRTRETNANGHTPYLGYWGQFTYYHSRYLCRRFGKHYSPLCVADKLASSLEPWWLYLPRLILTGELQEYMELPQGHQESKYHRLSRSTRSIRDWHRSGSRYLRDWAYEHRDGRTDTWTPQIPRTIPTTRTT